MIGPEPSRTMPPPDGGMTLLEVVIAALVLGISLTGVLSTLGSGRDQETMAYLRNQAAKVAKNAMEDSNYTSAKYAGFAPGSKEWSFPATAVLRSETDSAVIANVMIKVAPEDVKWFYNPDLGGFGQAVPSRKVSATVAWTFAGRSETIVLNKRIAEIQ